jgi:type I restriction enzyme S subunit
MTRELPQGWAEVELAVCVDNLDYMRVPVNSDDRSKRLGKVPYYGATGQVGWIDDCLFDEEILLIGEDGAPFLDKSKPISYIVRGKSWVNNHAHVLRAKTHITTNQYLMYFFNSFDFHDYVNGTTRLKLTQGAMNQIPVRLAPSAEQHRIVTDLDRLLKRTNECRKRLIRFAKILKRFRQSVLAAACSGRLTADWRERHDVESDWPTEPLSDLFIMRNGKSLTVAKRQEGKTPVFGGNGLMGTHSEANADGKVIVIGRVGAQCGNVHFISGKVWVTDNAISLQAKHELNPAFYALFLRTQNLNQMSAGTGQPYVSQEILSSIQTPILSLPEQDEIVRRVGALFALADKIETRYKIVQQQVDRLPQSILAKAFRGELVPTEAELAEREGRTYESAEQLLQRIRAAKSEAYPTEKDRRTTLRRHVPKPKGLTR